jgi:hypothetical protein
MNASDRNVAIRLGAFQFLDVLKKCVGDAMPRDRLEAGFDIEGIRVPLLGPQGNFRPAAHTRAPLSITTVPITEGKPRPYEDSEGEDGLIRYRYRGCIRKDSGSVLGHTANAAQCADSHTLDCWMQPTSCLMAIQGENRGSRMVARFARSIMPPTTKTFWDRRRVEDQD